MLGKNYLLNAAGTMKENYHIRVYLRSSNKETLKQIYAT